MKSRARLPRGFRWLGLMALGGVSLAVQAEEKIVLLTSWYAQAEQGGYYQAQATGLYKKYGLDVEIRSGGPQVNGMQLLLSKRADVIIGYDLQLLEGIQRGFQAKAIAAPFQYDPQGLLTHADVTSLQGLKDKTLLVSSSGQATWWPWLKAQYQLSDAQVRPYTFNIQPFVVDDAVAPAGLCQLRGVSGAEGRGEGELLPLFRTRLSPPTAASLSPARIPSPSVKRRWRSSSAPQWRAG